MKAKIISLIKKYRAKSEKNWVPSAQYSTWSKIKLSNVCDKVADDLEKLLEESEGE